MIPFFSFLFYVFVILMNLCLAFGFINGFNFFFLFILLVFLIALKLGFDGVDFIFWSLVLVGPNF